MPNWCNDRVVFYTDSTDNTNVLRLFEDLQAIYVKKTEYTEVDGSENWIGRIMLKAENKSPELHEELGCRAFVEPYSIELWDEDMAVFMSVDSAWTPADRAYGLLAERYDLTYVRCSEEPGCGHFSNTDVDGVYFPESYIMEDDENDIYQTYETFEELLDFLVKEDYIRKDDLKKIDTLYDLSVLVNETHEVNFYEYNAGY